MKRHTPGPWRFQRSRHGGRLFIGGPDGKLIAMMDEGTEKDAELIAASPSLLIALKTALTVISQHYPEGKKCCIDKIAKIRNVIASVECRYSIQNPVEPVKKKYPSHSATEGKGGDIKKNEQKKEYESFADVLKKEGEKPTKNPSNNPTPTRRGVPLELGSIWTEEKIKPKEYFDPRSFRYTRVPKTGALKAFVLVGCKKGDWDPKTNSCKVGTNTHVIFRPKKSVATTVAANPRIGQQVSFWEK